MRKILIMLVITLFFLLMSLIATMLHNDKIMWIFTLVFMFVLYLLKPINKFKQNKHRYMIKSNKYPPEFDNLYEELGKDHLSNLEYERKQARSKIIIQYSLFFIGFVLVFKLNEYIDFSTLNQVVLILFIMMIPLLFRNSVKLKKNYVNYYKKNIIAEFLKLINPSFNFDEVVVKTLNSYSDAKFVDSCYNDSYVNDTLSGNLAGTLVNISNIELYYKHHKYKFRTEVFKGLFVQIEEQRNLNTYIRISLNSLANDNKLLMDSSEFEKYFDVNTDNEVLAMQILTSDIMETLIKFHKEHGIYYEIVIRNNNIYIRFFTGKMFEPKIFGNSMDKELLFRYYCVISFVTELTTKMNKVVNEIQV